MCFLGRRIGREQPLGKAFTRLFRGLIIKGKLAELLAKHQGFAIESPPIRCKPLVERLRESDGRQEIASVELCRA